MNTNKIREDFILNPEPVRQNINMMYEYESELHKRNKIFKKIDNLVNAINILTNKEGTQAVSLGGGLNDKSGIQPLKLDSLNDKGDIQPLKLDNLNDKGDIVKLGGNLETDLLKTRNDIEEFKNIIENLKNLLNKLHGLYTLVDNSDNNTAQTEGVLAKLKGYNINIEKYISEFDKEKGNISRLKVNILKIIENYNYNKRKEFINKLQIISVYNEYESIKSLINEKIANKTFDSTKKNESVGIKRLREIIKSNYFDTIDDQDYKELISLNISSAYFINDKKTHKLRLSKIYEFFYDTDQKKFLYSIIKKKLSITTILPDLSELSDIVYTKINIQNDDDKTTYNTIQDEIKKQHKGGGDFNITIMSSVLLFIDKILDEILTKIEKKTLDTETSVGESSLKNIFAIKEKKAGVIHDIIKRYETTRNEITNTNELIKLDNEFLNLIDRLGINLEELFKININDKISFIIYILILHIITYSIIEFLIVNDHIDELITILGIYMLIYMSIIFITIFIINILVGFRLKILLNYLNTDFNMHGIIMHIFILVLFYLVVVILTGYITTIKIEDDDDKTPMLYRIEMISTIIFIFSSVFIIIL